MASPEARAFRYISGSQPVAPDMPGTKELSRKSEFWDLLTIFRSTTAL